MYPTRTKEQLNGYPVGTRELLQVGTFPGSVEGAIRCVI